MHLRERVIDGESDETDGRTTRHDGRVAQHDWG
jgi:hypothetical protein